MCLKCHSCKSIEWRRECIWCDHPKHKKIIESADEGLLCNDYEKEVIE